MDYLLLLEDDESFGYILSEYLALHNFQVDWAKTAEEALVMLQEHNYHLVLLDIMLPGMNGFELAEIIKKKFNDLPFIFLSAKSLKVDQLKGFKLGAYDYITKPVDEELLVAKIKALLKQTNHQRTPQECFQIGVYEFSTQLHQLKFSEEVTKLTARETELLKLLCEHQNQVLPRKKALKQIWETNDEFSRKSMDVFISRLRKYLAKDPNIKIENIHSKGFILHC